MDALVKADALITVPKINPNCQNGNILCYNSDEDKENEENEETDKISNLLDNNNKQDPVFVKLKKDAEREKEEKVKKFINIGKIIFGGILILGIVVFIGATYKKKYHKVHKNDKDNSIKL